MKKNTRKITSFVLGITTVSSIALALHFYSFKADFQVLEQSQKELNEKYISVLLENEELRQTNIVYYDEAKNASGLLEQSAMEIEKLNTENHELQGQVRALQKKSKLLQEKVVKLEKK